MRRPVLYLAGLLLATGASLALAAPASAAPNDHHCNKGHHHYMDDGYYDDYGYPGDYWSYSNSNDIDSYETYNGINVLNHLFSNNIGGGGLI